jgi:hypothetical protein
MTPVRPLDDLDYPDGGNVGPSGERTKPSEDSPDKGVQDQMQQHLAGLVNSAVKTAQYGGHPASITAKGTYSPKASDQQVNEKNTGKGGYMPTAADQQ